MAALIAYGAYVPHYHLEAAGRNQGRPGRRRGLRHRGRCRLQRGPELNGAGWTTAGAAPAGVKRPPPTAALRDHQPLLLWRETNANIVHAALALDPGALAINIDGTVRSGAGAFLVAARGRVLPCVVLSDVRTGRFRAAPTSAMAAMAPPPFGPVGGAPGDRRAGGPGVGRGGFLDRWRIPPVPPPARVWEEHFRRACLRTVGRCRPFSDALKQAGLGGGHRHPHRGRHPRPGRATLRGPAAWRPSANKHSLPEWVTSAGQPGLLLAHVLDTAQAGQTVALVILADGATAICYGSPKGSAPTAEPRL